MTHFSDDCYTPTENDRLNAIFSELECCVEGLFDGEDLDLNSRDALLAIVRKRFSGAPVEPVPAPELLALRKFSDDIVAWLVHSCEDLCPMCGRDPNSHDADCWVQLTLNAWEELIDGPKSAPVPAPPTNQPIEVTNQQGESNENQVASTSDHPDQIRDGSSRVGDGAKPEERGGVHPMVDVAGSFVQGATHGHLGAVAAPVEPPVLSRDAIDEMIAKIEREDGHEWNAVMAMESLRDAILESLISAPRECPTNHTCMDNYDENGDITTILWSDESIDYAFCPDCGTSLSPPVGTQE